MNPVPGTLNPEPAKPLSGHVALVAGATRGAGRGIARGLGEAGALVYCTGRSVRGQPSPYGRPETIDETAELITRAGGVAVPVRVDHTVEADVQALIDRIDREHGRLDVLVNSIAGEDPMMYQYKFTDADGRRPDWGHHAIDFSVVPPPLVDAFRTGTEIHLAWLETLARRTKEFRAKIPQVPEPRTKNQEPRTENREP